MKICFYVTSDFACPLLCPLTHEVIHSSQTEDALQPGDWNTFLERTSISLSHILRTQVKSRQWMYLYIFMHLTIWAGYTTSHYFTNCLHVSCWDSIFATQTFKIQDLQMTSTSLHVCCLILNTALFHRSVVVEVG